MTILIAGLAVFFGTHLLSTLAPALRTQLVRRLGDERYYRAGFAGLSLIGAGLMITGKTLLGEVPVWQAPAWGATAAALLMALSLLSLVASAIASNLRRLLRHPVLWGVTLWAGAHLLANGDLGSLLLFGAFLFYAPLAMASLSRRGKVPHMAKTPLFRDALVIALGAVVFGVVGCLHPYLFGVPAFAGLLMPAP